MCCRYSFLLLFLASWLPPLAHAQPAEVNRVLRTFDFEERRLGNPEDLPMHWSKVEGVGLPHYVNGMLSTDRSHGGEYSFRFDLNGGSLLYRYDAGQIRVQPGAHYRVEGWVQTTPLANARARISAYFTDQDFHPLPDSIVHSEQYAATKRSSSSSSQRDPSWKRLSLELSADPGAAYLVIELGLLQPSFYAPNSLGDRTLFTQDIRGSAWFDDISVSQVPRVTMSTDRPGNIFRRGETLALQVLVNDRFTDDLAAQLVIRDAKGNVVYQRSGALDMSVAENLGPGQKRMSLVLPAELPPGWYEASLVMSSQGQFVGDQALDLVLLADDAPSVTPDSRFGLIATDLPFDGWRELPDILPFLAAGRVKLAVWSEAGDIEQLNAASFDHLLERLGEIGVTPTACLIGLPPELARTVNGGSWLQLLRSPTESWQPQLAYMVSRHANHLDRWQLGADGSDAFVTQPQMRQVYSRVYAEFAALVDDPDLAMPWPAWYELDGQLPATVALSVPPSVLPSQLPLYIEDLRGKEGHNLSLSVELLDRQQYGREMQIKDLAQRVVYALAANAQRIDVPLPFTVRRVGDDVVKQPQELLMIVRTLITTLGGSTFKGKVPIGEGVEAFLFQKDNRGIMVVWDRGNEGGVKQLALNLGDEAIRLDLWGNATPLVQGRGGSASAAGNAGSAGGKDKDTVALDIGPMPIFLVDIDGAQAQLRASVRFDRPLLESSFEPHVRRIQFVNPYPQAIGGSLKLRAPQGWTLNPPTFTFNLNPGEVFDRELTIEFPYNSFAGAKTINAEFLVQGERNSTFVVPIVLNLGLSDVGMQTLALRDGKDVLVQQMITNYGDKPIDYTAFAIFPGQARQERLVTNLGAGRTTIKLYRFNDVKLTPDLKVRVGVKELVGTRILNEEVAIQ